ncbi:MAG: hypothetical protein B7Z80_14790 [Rhodospirillales bacterium 20-64-7]|nr:MAG: hypothetical protein B7Z80_14790 [Rhodospirillales bacterium 20-64-7]
MAAKPQRSFTKMRTFLKFLAGIILVLALAWVGLWWYAEARMESGLTAWVKQSSANGDLTISYDSVRRGSSPLAATATLTNLRIVLGTTGAQPVTLTLPSFTTEIDAGNPLLLHFDLPPQINFVTSRGNASMTFGSIVATEQIDAQTLFNANVPPFSGSHIDARNIGLLAAGSLLILHADRFTSDSSVNRHAGPKQNALTASEQLDGLALSPLLTKLARVPFDGKLTELGLTLNLSGPVPANWSQAIAKLQATPASDRDARRSIAVQEVHAWATNGGSGSASLTATVGLTTLNAAGSLAFDANVQPNGKATASANHLDAFTTALTDAYPNLQAAIAVIEARLSPYLSTTPNDGQTLALHVTYGPPGVTINGQQVAPMPTVDWTKLEATPTAAGPGAGQ